ncbi:hypothetical protein PENSUB_3284 [Penicillium subrubescens]|uniref:Uncharacterized protein n=1 Tax=Penicillium subrubescens TaxID=1316194 RepID=A0A1Q5UFM8_9EURO|nr:hypothetical protein PENSUB_3284 [Penicillium subrubescens]
MNGGGPGQRFVPRPCSWKGQKTGSEPQEPTKRNILKAPPVSLQERMKDEEISEMEDVSLLITVPSPSQWGYIRLGCKGSSVGRFVLWDLQVWGMGKTYVAKEELACGTS